jgi:hypothetical protein
MAFVLFGAAFVRGYSGFGMPALVMTSAALVMDPLVWVPVVLMADIVLTVQQWPGIWRQIDWRRVLTMFGGALIGVPLGVWVLAGVGVDLARAVLSVFVLAMCALLWAGWSFRRPVGDAAHGAMGLVSGVANGAAVGGLPIAVFFTAQGIPAVKFRATIIGYFALLDVWSMPVLWYAGRITQDTLLAVALSLPFLMAGIVVGSKVFQRSEPKDFRRFAILLLMVLASLGLVKSIV